jgi:hypothetical protein
VSKLNSEERKALAKAVESMEEDSVEYKGMNGFKKQLLSLLTK